MMDFDEPTIRESLTESEWRVIQTLVQTSFVMLAPRLGSRRDMGRLLAAEMRKNPIYRDLSPAHRFQLWRYTVRLIDVAYMFSDDS